MNTFLKNFGIILIIIGVIVLGLYSLNPPTSNTPLAMAALLMVGGIAVHVIFNRIID
jgi:multisubunit Na+/H+ antiporter MnhG subunit